MAALDEFTRSYIETALWSSTDDNGVQLDHDYSITDIAPETLERMRADCAEFQTAQSNHLDVDGAPSLRCAGSDFWLTRNGHGAGFWDGGWPEPQGRLLTAACRPYGTVNLYVGDDGRIWS